VLSRSTSRAISGEPIFNGNVETFRAWLSPEHPVQWAWTQYGNRRDDMRERFANPAYSHVRKFRFDRPHKATRWLATAF
jgi:hypothetical protein